MPVDIEKHIIKLFNTLSIDAKIQLQNELNRISIKEINEKNSKELLNRKITNDELLMTSWF